MLLTDFVFWGSEWKQHEFKSYACNMILKVYLAYDVNSWT